ncbi:hypothetical protein DFH29DRAFT_1002669 [Suillus ampliporus]|nr:hypothetical protein DFH29DRAFT_1002669 [Suillus ampliporus]
MAPHIHQVPSLKSTPGGKKAIKNENTEQAIKIFSGSSSSGTDVNSVRINVNLQIHPEDVAQFVQFGFDEQVKQLATCSGFQAAVVYEVYGWVTTFKRTKRTMQVMRTAAFEWAKIDIEEQEAEDLYASGNESEDDGVRDQK